MSSLRRTLPWWRLRACDPPCDRFLRRCKGGGPPFSSRVCFRFEMSLARSSNASSPRWPSPWVPGAGDAAGLAMGGGALKKIRAQSAAFSVSLSLFRDRGVLRAKSVPPPQPILSAQSVVSGRRPCRIVFSDVDVVLDCWNRALTASQCVGRPAGSLGDVVVGSTAVSS